MSDTEEKIESPIRGRLDLASTPSAAIGPVLILLEIEIAELCRMLSKQSEGT